MARGHCFVLVAFVALVFAFTSSGVSAVTQVEDVTAIRNLYTALGRPPKLALWADPILALDPCNGTGPAIPNINCTLAAPPASYVITSLDLRNTGELLLPPCSLSFQFENLFKTTPAFYVCLSCLFCVVYVYIV